MSERRRLPAAGAAVVTYEPGDGTYRGHPWADRVVREPAAGIDTAVDVLLRELAAHAVSVDEPALVDGLLRRGATVLRHAHELTLDLRSPSVRPLGPPPGVRVTAVGADDLWPLLASLGEVALRAYAGSGEGYADQPDAVAELADLLGGEQFGPVHPASRLATRAGAPVGLCLVVDRLKGLWVIDCFRDPADPGRGTGAALLSAAVAALAPQETSLGLAVRDGNTAARRLYERLGFVEVAESVTVLTP